MSTKIWRARLLHTANKIISYKQKQKRPREAGVFVWHLKIISSGRR